MRFSLSIFSLNSVGGFVRGRGDGCEFPFFHSVNSPYFTHTGLPPPFLLLSNMKQHVIFHLIHTLMKITMTLRATDNMKHTHFVPIPHRIERTERETKNDYQQEYLPFLLVLALAFLEMWSYFRGGLLSIVDLTVLRFFKWISWLRESHLACRYLFPYIGSRLGWWASIGDKKTRWID